MSTRTNNKQEPRHEHVIETSPIRLSAEETRLIIRVANNKSKPICDYRACGLVDMGILEECVIPEEDRTKELNTLWGNAYNFAGAKQLEKLSACLDKIRKIVNPPSKKEGFVLTALGKQIARGITVKLNGQYAPTKC